MNKTYKRKNAAVLLVVKLDVLNVYLYWLYSNMSCMLII